MVVVVRMVVVVGMVVMVMVVVSLPNGEGGHINGEFSAVLPVL